MLKIYPTGNEFFSHVLHYLSESEHLWNDQCCGVFLVCSSGQTKDNGNRVMGTKAFVIHVGREWVWIATNQSESQCWHLPITNGHVSIRTIPWKKVICSDKSYQQCVALGNVLLRNLGKPHKSHIVADQEYSFMVWLSNLSLIKHLWAVPDSSDQWKSHLLNRSADNLFVTNTFRGLVESMPWLVRAVLRTQGASREHM